MFGEFSHFREFIMSFFEIKKDSILEPLTCLVRLSIIDFKPLGTKISLNNNRIKYNDPNMLQGALRWSNGDNREDLHNLYNPLIKATQWYDHEDEQIRNIFKYAVKGLQKLQSSYNKNTVISHSIQLYIDYLEKYLDGEKLEKETEEESTISKELKALWNEREITILNNILLQLEDNRKKNTPELIEEQNTLITTLETILARKEDKVTNILFENTTTLN